MQSTLLVKCFNLTNLNYFFISDNKLDIPDNPCLLEFAFKNLIHLTMSRMGYTWKDVIQCAFMYPQVQCLSVSHP